MPAVSSRFSRRLFLDVALPSAAAIGLLIVLSWVGAAMLRHSQARTLAAYRVETLRKHLASQGENLNGLGQMLMKSWISLNGDRQASEHAAHAALPLLRQQDLVSNLILCSPDGNFLTLLRTPTGWDLIEGGPAIGSGRARLTEQVDTPGSQVSWVRLPDGYPANRPWFKEGMALKRSGWMSDPYQFAGTPVGGLSYLAPVFDAEGRRLGLICIDSTQARLSRVMGTILENPFCRAMITDASRRVVVPPQWPSMPDPTAAFHVFSVKEVPWTNTLLAHATGGEKTSMDHAVIGDLGFLTFRAPMNLGSGFLGELWVAYPMTARTSILRDWAPVATLLLSLLMLAWLLYLKQMSGRYDQPMQRLLLSAEAARQGIEVPDLDSDIWEIRQMGRSLKLAGDAVRERQGLEDRLIQTQRFEIMSALSSGVIHDSNNVLSIVMMRIERAIDQDWQPRTKEELGEGLIAARQCLAMNRQLLNLGRKDEVPLQQMDLNDCVRDACLLVRPALGREVALEVELTEAPLPVAVRAVELTQVILNLALNARDAMPEGGLLRIRTFRQDSQALLEIEDGGEGIPEAIQAQIFEPYFTTKPKGKGTGLGLAVVKRVMERHQGRIDLARRPGRGQCFLLTFPLIEEGYDPLASTSA